MPNAMTKAGLTGEDMGLPLSEKTVADYLKTQGYRSMIIGKWHQGGADRFHPLKRGFDEFYGFRGGARSYFAYKKGEKDDRLYWMERNFLEFKEHKGYLTDVLADEACTFIERNQERPFFLFLSFTAVHAPMHALKEDMAQFPKLKGNRRKLAAMTLAMDRACGRVLDKLDTLGLADNTLVVFTNDNGGTPQNSAINTPLSGVKATHPEGGIRVPFLIKWPSKLTAETLYEYPVSLLDLLPTFVDLAGGATTLSKIDGVSLLPFLKGRMQGDRIKRSIGKKRRAQPSATAI